MGEEVEREWRSTDFVGDLGGKAGGYFGPGSESIGLVDWERVVCEAAEIDSHVEGFLVCC